MTLLFLLSILSLLLIVSFASVDTLRSGLPLLSSLDELPTLLVLSSRVDHSLQLARTGELQKPEKRGRRKEEKVSLGERGSEGREEEEVEADLFERFLRGREQEQESTSIRKYDRERKGAFGRTLAIAGEEGGV